MFTQLIFLRKYMFEINTVFIHEYFTPYNYMYVGFKYKSNNYSCRLKFWLKFCAVVCVRNKQNLQNCENVWLHTIYTSCDIITARKSHYKMFKVENYITNMCPLPPVFNVSVNFSKFIMAGLIRTLFVLNYWRYFAYHVFSMCSKWSHIIAQSFWIIITIKHVILFFKLPKLSECKGRDTLKLQQIAQITFYRILCNLIFTIINS